VPVQRFFGVFELLVQLADFFYFIQSLTPFLRAQQSVRLLVQCVDLISAFLALRLDCLISSLHFG
jgi:hypothetical protein